MDERLYSRPLDVHRISEYPEVQRMITYLFDEMKSIKKLEDLLQVEASPLLETETGLPVNSKEWLIY